MDGDNYSIELCDDINRIPREDWNTIAGTENPFVCHSFLAALEAGKAVGGETGWEPLHLLMRDDNGKLLGAMPNYLKNHSYGEYVFDHSWADGFIRAGGQYYPKMLSAVPFTPVTGPRLMTGKATGTRRHQLIRGLANGMTQYVDKLQLSSAHINFLPMEDTETLVNEGWLIRHSIQFHWRNEGYLSFEDFLASLSSRKRKNIRKERKSLVDAGVKMLQLTGAAIKSHHIDDFYRFYMSTINRKWGGAYLTREVFEHLHFSMADRMLLVMAEYQGHIIGGALNFIGSRTLYGRTWGSDLNIPNLHFEACYYQAIDYAINNKLSSVEAGAQGFHKVQRGYLPVKTFSAHWIAHTGFKNAVARFLSAEERGINEETNYITLASPFKSGSKPN